MPVIPTYNSQAPYLAGQLAGREALRQKLEEQKRYEDAKVESQRSQAMSVIGNVLSQWSANRSKERSSSESQIDFSGGASNNSNINTGSADNIYGSTLERMRAEREDNKTRYINPRKQAEVDYISGRQPAIYNTGNSELDKLKAQKDMRDTERFVNPRKQAEVDYVRNKIANNQTNSRNDLIEYLKLKGQELDVALKEKKLKGDDVDPVEKKLKELDVALKEKSLNKSDDTITQKIKELDVALKEKKLRGEGDKIGEYDKDTLSRATNLRKEFQASPTYKIYNEVEQSFKRMEEAIKLSESGNRIASDQVLAVVFQKMLDPESVVRESEYARSSEGAAILNRAKAYLPQLAQGGLNISNEERQALYLMAQKLLGASKSKADQEISKYRVLAKNYNVPENLIFGDSFTSPSTATNSASEIDLNSVPLTDIESEMRRRGLL